MPETTRARWTANRISSMFTVSFGIFFIFFSFLTTNRFCSRRVSESARQRLQHRGGEDGNHLHCERHEPGAQLGLP